MKDFFKLRDRVEKGIATPEERVAYFRKLASRHYDHLIEDDLDASLKETPTPILHGSRGRILGRSTDKHLTPRTLFQKRIRTATYAVAVVGIIGMGIWLALLLNKEPVMDGPL
jgi:hypothetical protein